MFFHPSDPDPTVDSLGLQILLLIVRIARFWGVFGSVNPPWFSHLFLGYTVEHNVNKMSTTSRIVDRVLE